MLNLHLALNRGIEETLNLKHTESLSINERISMKFDGYAAPKRQSSMYTNILRGSDVFENKFPLLENLLDQMFLKEKFFDIYQSRKLDIYSIEDIDTKFYEIFKILYDDTIFESVKNDFGNYFRSLYRIIKMVNEQEFFITRNPDTELKEYKIKYYYTSIVRAHLSDFEIKWLFFNCLSNKGNEKFKSLVEKYSLLKILYGSSDGLIQKFYHLYHHQAFEKNSILN